MLQLYIDATKYKGNSLDNFDCLPSAAMDLSLIISSIFLIFCLMIALFCEGGIGKPDGAQLGKKSSGLASKELGVLFSPK